MNYKKAPIPIRAQDSLPDFSNGVPVLVWGTDYEVMFGDDKLDDGRSLSELSLGETADLRSGVMVVRCEWAKRSASHDRMGGKDRRGEVQGMMAKTFSEADARAFEYVDRHARLHREDIVTCLEVMGMIPLAPKHTGIVHYLKNEKGDYVVRMKDRAEFNYWLNQVDGVEQWVPKSTHLYTHTEYDENGAEMFSETRAAQSLVTVGNVDGPDWSAFEFDCDLLGLKLVECSYKQKS